MQVNLTSTKLNNVQRKLYVYTYRCGDKLAKSKKILNIKVHSATNTALTTYDNYCLWAGGIYVIIFCKKILNVKSYHQQQWYKLVVNSLRAVGSCETFYYDKHGTSHSQNHALSIQGIIVLTGTETFAKEPKFAKLLQGMKCRFQSSVSKQVH